MAKAARAANKALPAALEDEKAKVFELTKMVKAEKAKVINLAKKVVDLTGKLDAALSPLAKLKLCDTGEHIDEFFKQRSMSPRSQAQSQACIVDFLSWKSNKRLREEGGGDSAGPSIEAIRHDEQGEMNDENLKKARESTQLDS